MVTGIRYEWLATYSPAFDGVVSVETGKYRDPAVLDRSIPKIRTSSYVIGLPSDKLINFLRILLYEITRVMQAKQNNNARPMIIGINTPAIVFPGLVMGISSIRNR